MDVRELSVSTFAPRCFPAPTFQIIQIHSAYVLLPFRWFHRIILNREPGSHAQSVRYVCCVNNEFESNVYHPGWLNQ